jgi:hypothetical protein
MCVRSCGPWARGVSVGRWRGVCQVRARVVERSGIAVGNCATPRSPRTTPLWIVTLLLLGVFTVSPASAHARIAGSISGTVRDASGGVLPGATVTLMNVALQMPLVTTTDAKGLYTFPDIAVGRYDLTITLDGFRPLTRAGLVVSTDSRLVEDATLAVGGQRETVTVVAAAVHVDLVSTQQVWSLATAAPDHPVRRHTTGYFFFVPSAASLAARSVPAVAVLTILSTNRIVPSPPM